MPSDSPKILSVSGKLASRSRWYGADDPIAVELKREHEALMIRDRCQKAAAAEPSLTVEQRADAAAELAPNDADGRAEYIDALIERAAPEHRDIWREVAAWPPLTAGQRSRLALLLRDGRG